MQIAIIENGAVVQVGDYRELFPTQTWPGGVPSAEWLAANGAMGVTVWKAHDARTQKLVGSNPYIEGGTVYTVMVEPKSQAEQDSDTASQAAQVRAERSRLLAACDWTQVADAPVDQAAWATYRQALRDITAQAGFPWTVEWPHDPDYVPLPEQPA